MTNNNSFTPLVKSNDNTKTDKIDFTALFLNDLFLDGFTYAEDSLEAALQKIEEKFIGSIKNITNEKSYLNYFYNRKGNYLIPNRRNNEIMAFWDVFKDFYSSKYDKYRIIRCCFILNFFNNFVETYYPNKLKNICIRFKMN